MTQKLAKLTIKNIKNVAFGQVDFRTKENFLNVVGVYGQNGSGKTTLVDALGLLRDIFSGNELPTSFMGMINLDQPAEISLETEVIHDKKITYSVTVERKATHKGGDILQITKENIQTQLLKKYQKKQTLVDFDANELTRLAKFNLNLDVVTVLADVSLNDSKSFLFHPTFKKIIAGKKGLEKLQAAMGDLESLGHNLKIYTAEYSGLIAANIITPVGIHYSEGPQEIRGLLPFDMTIHGNFFPEKVVPIYKRVVEQINSILPQIIPGLTLALNEQEARLGENNEREVRLEFVAQRGGKQFSLIYESDGIKKIIGLLTYFVEAYSNPNIVAVIDEFDAGIYEYLLGELIAIFSTGAKGQLIFTSHNLRILEVLDPSKIIFSTTNPNNRYIRMKNIKKTNNLRDTYLRAIQLGGQDEPLYDGKSAAAIRLSLMKAGETFA